MLRPSDDSAEPFKPDLSEGLENGLYLALLELIDEGLIIASDEMILDANDAACRLLERSYGQLVRQPLATLFPTEQAFLTARGRLFIQGQMRGSLHLALPGGRVREMRFCAAARLRPGLHALILSPDYLAEAGPEALAGDSLWPRLAAALEQPVVVVDDQERIAAANAPALRRLPLAREGLVGRRLDEFLAIRWPAPGAEPLARLEPPGGEAETARLLPGPRPGWRLLILPPERDAAAGSPPQPTSEGGPNDHTPLPRHDAQPGLVPMDRLGQAFAEARSRGGRLAMVHVRVERLGAVYDQSGPAAAERLQQQVAQRLGAALPAAAQVARQGGEAFVALLPGVDAPGDLEAAARALAACLEEPLHLDGQALAPEARLGVAVFPDDGNAFETLRRHAEVACGRARQAGDRLRFYADEMNTQSLERRALEASLGQAMERGEMRLHFVPEWHSDGRLTAEALLRWQHPDLGLIPGRRLLPLLRQSGLLAVCGAWTLREACAQAARWAAADRALRLVVNVALEQLAAPDFADGVQAALAETGLPPESLELDVEEAVLAYGEEVHLEALAALAEAGVGLAIDNFGQGLASIRRLGSLPLASLRLDPELVRLGLASSPAVLEATLALAQPLGLQVVAKGVDQEAQRLRLVDMGFTALQGACLGRPLDAATFARFHLGLG